MTLFQQDAQLTQVVFVHDYVQFVFSDATLSIYNPIVVEANGQRYLQADTGYRDELVKLIGQHLIEERIETGNAARLNFDGGSVVNILLDPHSALGPEAFQFCDGKGHIIVEQNA